MPVKKKRKIRKRSKLQKRKTGLKTPAKPFKKAVASKKRVKKDVAKVSPRWLKGSSSLKRFGMENRREDARCADGGCEKVKVGDSVSLVGVVVDTDTTKKNKISDVSGKLKKGHYSENTPGVYLK